MLRHPVHVALLLALALTGCARVLTPIGEERYDCNRKEDPSSPYCHSFRGVEEGTAGPMPDSRFDRQLQVATHDRLQGIAPTVAPAPAAAPVAPAPTPGARAAILSGGTAIAAAPAGPAPANALEGLPVRQGPLIQRVWVKRFADGNDLLVSDTTIYKEIMPTRWLGVVDTGSPPGQRGVGAAAQAYPHRPPAPTGNTRSASAANPVNPAGAANATQTGATPVSSAAQPYAQPGQARAQRGPELVSVPASESGTLLPD